MTADFLKVPPFPGAKAFPFVRPGQDEASAQQISAALVANRVGGSFWEPPQPVSEGRAILLVPDDKRQLEAMLAEAGGRGVTVIGPAGRGVASRCATLNEPCDPWTLADRAEEVWCGSDHGLATIAALLGKPVRVFDRSGASREADLASRLLARLAAQSYASPFDGETWPLLRLIDQMGEWRRMIEANRSFAAIYGVARWKRITTDPLLWDGTGPVRHARTLPPAAGPETMVLAWKSRTPARVLAQLEAAGASVAELEDGMIRSVGLGANCVPPLSVITDSSGVYFDPNAPNDLEILLECGELPAQWVKRAKDLRTTLVQAGISKYGQGEVTKPTLVSEGRRILVTGQVEDDRSVLSGGANCTNLELIARTRALEPDAWIIYKPHPDVEAGHRKGHVPDHVVLRHANEIERHAPIADLISRVDAVHVITSLAGFEALLRGKEVTTHGQPFYAGWGLTRDLAPPNPRRTRKRSLDELVAATLIGYPRYVDPVTRLPCPPEVLLRRIMAGQARVTSWLVVLREWQGRLRLAWQKLAGVR